MKELPASSLPARPDDLPVSAVLGLSEKGDLDWARLRGLQYSALAKVAFYRVFSHAILAVFVAQIYLEKVGFAGIGVWMVLLAAVHARGYRLDLSLADTQRRRITRSELNRQTMTAVMSAVVWGGAVLVFPFFGSDADLMAMLIVVALMISGSVFFYTAAPLGIMWFSAIVGAAAMIHLGLAGYWLAVGAVLLFLMAAMLGTIEVGRTYLAARMAEAAVTEKDEVVSLLLREFEENEADWLWEIDPARRLRAVSPRFAFALGRAQSAIEGRPLLEMIAGRNWEDGKFPPSLHDLAERLKNRENFSNLLVQVTILGEERWWELSGTPMRDENGNFTGFRGVGSDVTEQRKSSEKIAYLARFDPLTQLPNRLQVTEALGEALRYANQWHSRCALLMVDLDRFKAVNDSLGHLTGDKLLAQVSARLQSLMGDKAMCGRLGGDEFAIVIRDVTAHGAVRELARRVIDRLSEPYQVDHHTLYVGASVGSAEGPRDGNSVEELMRNADLALYRAKDMGGGEHCRFEPVLHASAEERRQLEVALRKALGRDEMLLHYQPVVDARSEKVVSFEALVRWNSADHGFVSPGKFIPLAEDTRLIVPIGKWVMRKACEEARHWPENVKVNVNVSPEQLLEPGFHDDVVEALAATGLRPERLEVEVTESIFLRDASIARNALEQVMALGCSVALDDFGTGYSSLGYLRKLRFSTIKVDRTFVQGAAQGAAESLAIINAVVAMAKSLNMSTTAEGVETAEEAELIRNLGCDKIQGYYFGRPMTADEARRLFTTLREMRA
ncbi:putative bifunctional diguanylate cyclase/phosphodiesterase [Porphyrobacter sp. LM 6]|uniref:putative bifunctional diguanylate cyclase/phosphodiesterase n=1 Tax=Porphyrobacter sp. LM 6 TaxID=1896196 RepID=UPI0008475319|nr:EAL domain-containing protein [Porphyrobacter sp. LM 6]AOL94334.1 diguanylate cyclase/phosphodiesterase with PAS/PAC sensor(s) [Porphyrobacter sp. LM 6]